MAGPISATQIFDYRGFEAMFDESVTVSATGKPERVSETPVTMDIITAEDIKRSGARDLATLLRFLPGIVNYRGYNGTACFSIGAILLNGREFFLGSLGEYFLSALPVELEEIRQIEVVRGPQSALYGFNAAKGVINIITYDPSDDDVNLLRARVGNDGHRDGAAILTTKLMQGVGIRLTASDDHSHDVGELAGSQSVPPRGPERRVLSTMLGADLTNGDHATFELSHSDVSLRALAPQTPTFFDMRLQSDSVKADYSAQSTVGQLGATFFYTSLRVPNAETKPHPASSCMIIQSMAA